MRSIDNLLGSGAEPLAISRNIFWDICFYDVKALSPAEMKEFSVTPDQEGAVIVVSPGNANRKIRHYASGTEMLKEEGRSIGGVAISGVGSSVVGTAALARNVADAYGFDVAGVVSGYGVSDLIAEAMGGWFFYRYTERLRHSIEILIEKAAGTLLASFGLDNAGGGRKITHDRRDHAIPRQLESGTLLDILSAHPKNLKVLVGHSKGAILINYVLDQFVHRMEGNDHPYYDDLHVVTIGVVVGIAKEFTKSSQLIGKLDWFGGINSLPSLLWETDPNVRPRFIENAWHHLNREIPFNLRLSDALAKHVALD